MVHPVAERALAHFDELFPLHPRRIEPDLVQRELPQSLPPGKLSVRYKSVTTEKANGETYTPTALATFIAQRIVEHFDFLGRSSLDILDPAVGDGSLILALLDETPSDFSKPIRVHLFDTNRSALDQAVERVRAAYPDVEVDAVSSSFLDYALVQGAGNDLLSLAYTVPRQKYDVIIANPPYVRTQVMGSEQARRLSSDFGLTGRVDMYQAFVLAMSGVLKCSGTLGFIVSNRFMTTRGGSTLREALRTRTSLREVWDLGDTKLFDAAVLPAVIVATGDRTQPSQGPSFCSIYETDRAADGQANEPLSALGLSGVVEITDGRRFEVRHGELRVTENVTDVWCLASNASDDWLGTVLKNTWRRFGEIGKIRVGVKTCADKVFIRSDWQTACGGTPPELLRPVTTHHGAGRYRAKVPAKPKAILYPHESVGGRRRATDLALYPASRAYLEAHRGALTARSYVIEGGRQWYELWVPQDPAAWANPKIVFRDISERPTFWIDPSGSIVNGDCYWLSSDCPEDIDLLWLAAAVANSSFSEAFYDHSFNNKLYAGRRRYITQYVEKFPLPDPTLPESIAIISMAKAIYAANHGAAVSAMEAEVNAMVWSAFGLAGKEISR